MKQQSIGFVVGAVVAIIIALFVLPPSKSGSIKEHKAVEARLKSIVAKQAKDISVLKSSNTVLTVAYTNSKDSVLLLLSKPAKVKIVYKTAREATDQRTDSVNLYNEVMAARGLIDTQEEHINSLLILSGKADALLALRLQIIQKQDTLLNTWQDRFDNLNGQKTEEVKREKLKGRRKFWLGFGLGFVTREALEYIP